MSEYQMRDLGYPRTPTDKTLVVTFSDGTRWSIPIQVIADHRDTYYAHEQEDTVGFITKSGGLGDYEIEDWAGDNMNWSDVKEWATQLHERIQADYDREWPNADKDYGML